MKLSKLSWEELRKKEFLIDFLNTGLDWEVSEQDIELSTTRRAFIDAHIRNSGSHLILTKRILSYPNRTIFALSTISNAICLRTLLIYLATDGKFLFGPFNPILELKGSDDILIYLFGFYYAAKFKDIKRDTEVLKDYLEMVFINNRSPNLKITSSKRLLLEHDRLVADIELEDTPEFEIRDPDILPSEKDGYHFACISSRALLIAEAKEMKHCVAIYADEIISGESIIYSIRGKERATVEFADYGYGFAMCQVYSYYNKEVSAELQLLLSEVGDNNLKIGNRIT